MIRGTKEAGVDADEVQADRVTPLHIAAKNGNAAIVRDLLGAGADMRPDKDQKTCF